MSSQTNAYPTIRLYLLCYLALFLCLIIPFSSYSANEWQELSPGIEYQDLLGGIMNPWSHAHAFRVDLKSNKMGVVSAKSLRLKNASADQFAEHTKALISVNGGFFDHDFKPLGLRINDNNLENPLKRISWWGVFYIKDNVPHITSARRFQYSDNIHFAVQSGPRLIVNGKIPSLKKGSADRTALGITADGKVIVLVTNNSAMSTKELARLMKASPLSCIDAINLDGGSSSQLFARMNTFQLNVHGFSNVSDAVIVKAK